MSPEEALGKRFNRAPILHTATIFKFLAPELSAQLTTAALGRPAEILCLIPEAAARPRSPFSPMLLLLLEKERDENCERMVARGGRWMWK